MRYVFLIAVLFCSGCSSVNVVSKDVFYSLNEFRDTEVKKLIDYIENDPNLTERDRNTFRVKLESFDGSLKVIKPSE